MAGAVAGGAITTSLSWRWVFLINVPIGAVLMAVAMTSLAGTRTGGRQSLDLTGAVTGTAGLAALIYGVMQSAGHGWASAQVLGPAGAGLLLLVVFTVVEARFSTQPMLPLRLFRTRRVTVGNVMLLLFGAIAIAMWYFTSLFLQNVLGYSALRAGLGQTPAAVTFVVVARWAAALLPRTGVRPLVLAGCGCFLVGFSWLAQAHTHSSYAASVLGPTLLIAVGIGLTFPTLMAAATADAPEGDAGTIGGLASTSSQVGGSVGLAALATAASARAAAGGRPRPLPSPPATTWSSSWRPGSAWPSRWLACCCRRPEPQPGAGRPGLLRPSELPPGNPAPDRGQRDDHPRRDSGQPAPGLGQPTAATRPSGPDPTGCA